MKPLIGITANFEPGEEHTGGRFVLNANYVQAIADAGGVPVILARQDAVEELAGQLDGLLVPGGDDIDPAEYGQEIHEKTKLVRDERYDFEKRLFQAIERTAPEMPYLGICYGCQFLAVQMGGQLVQHIEDDLQHTGGPLQSYQVASGSRLGEIVGSAAGRSYHHQAVSDPGPSLQVSARHEDGTIEAVEDQSRPFRLGVQWHPERTQGEQDSQKLFAAFVQAATDYRKGKTSS